MVKSYSCWRVSGLFFFFFSGKSLPKRMYNTEQMAKSMTNPRSIRLYPCLAAGGKTGVSSTKKITFPKSTAANDRWKVYQFMPISFDTGNPQSGAWKSRIPA